MSTLLLTVGERDMPTGERNGLVLLEGLIFIIAFFDKK